MTTDKELLELAAKAAGIEVIGQMGDDGLHLFNGQHWNPLTDDGDALRLAVKLELRLRVAPAEVRVGWLNHILDPREVIEQITDDPYAATRRAIVRAAAEIGKGMK